MSRFPVNPLPTTSWSRESWEAAVSQAVPRRPWDRFMRDFNPKPGEHVAIIGPTGQGKTILQTNILPKYPFVAAFATKPLDKSMDRLVTEHGYIRLAKWYRLNPIDHPRRIIWPDASNLNSVDLQKTVFENAFNHIFREGGRPANNPVGWAVAIDELWYIVNMLGLSQEVKLFLLQGRSLGESLIVATQRPSSVPLEVYDQSTHLFFFRDNDRRNLDRLSEINTRADSRVMRMTISNLEDHQVLYVNTRNGMMLRTRAPAPIGG